MGTLERIASTWVLAWCASLFIAQGCFMVLFRRSSYFARTPAFAAHQAVCFAPLVYLAFEGTRMWFFDGAFAAALEDDQIWGHYEPGIAMVQVMLAFQIWDVTICLMVAELRKVDNLLHHASVMFLAFNVLRLGDHGFLVYYCAFFFGVTELSSLPLTMMDFFKMNHGSISRLRKKITSIEETGGDAELEKQQLHEIADFDADYPTLNLVCTISFAASFMILRNIYWPFVCLAFYQYTWSQCCNIILAIWYFLNIALSILQYYWGCLIVKGAVSLAKGGDKKSGDVEARELLQEVFIEK